MRRTLALVAMAGAVVLLAGCGSTSGNAAPASSTPSSSVVSTSSASSSSEASSSSDMSTMSSMESTASSDTDSSSSESDGGATTTVGNNSGTLDAQSTNWFDKFCTGAAPIADLATISSQIGSSTSDPKAAQKTFVSILTKDGGALSSAADSLKDVAPPTFDGGAEFANNATTALGALGAALTEAGKKAAAVDVAKDPSGLLTALSSLSTSMSGVGDALSNTDLTQSTQDALKKIPSCAKLDNIGG